MSNVVEIEKKKSLIEQAEEVINFLNSKTEKAYRARNPKGNPTSNSEYVIARLKEGYTVQECKQVIASKCRGWLHDEKMNRYLRPATLFARGNFETYLGELGD